VKPGSNIEQDRLPLYSEHRHSLKFEHLNLGVYNMDFKGYINTTCNIQLLTYAQEKFFINQALADLGYTGFTDGILDILRKELEYTLTKEKEIESCAWNLGLPPKPTVKEALPPKYRTQSRVVIINIRPNVKEREYIIEIMKIKGFTSLPQFILTILSARLGYTCTNGELKIVPQSTIPVGSLVYENASPFIPERKNRSSFQKVIDELQSTVV